MDCKTCADLLVVCKLAEKLYTKALRNLSGWAGEDFRLAFEQAERLWLEWRNANDALTAHQHHLDSNLAPNKQSLETTTSDAQRV
jgi:hypothetical protein